MTIRLAANISLLFAELPYLQRPAAAAAAGFAAVETWWPFGADSKPAAAKVDEFLAAIRDAGVELVGLNLFAGDMPAGDRGILSIPDRATEFRQSTVIVSRIAAETGCALFNALYGVRDARFDPTEQDRMAAENLKYAADTVGAEGGTVLIEALADGENGSYPLRSPSDVQRVIESSGRTNVRMLADFYHFARNGFDFRTVLDESLAAIAHIQIADAPGRHEPGTGTIAFGKLFEAVRAVNYPGWVGAEYRPLAATPDGLHWIDDLGLYPPRKGPRVKRVGLIGLGIMGRPMAANLLAAGFALTVHSRRRESADALIDAGAEWAETVGEVAAGRDAVITMLPDSPDVEQVALGAGGVLDRAQPGTLYIDMSTIRPEVARSIAGQAVTHGVRALDAPVSGGERGAIDGTLSIMVGGSVDDFALAQPVFQALSKTIARVGPSGSGQTVKAANQLLVGGIIELLAEALLLIERSGVDVESALSVLAGGLAGSRVLDLKGASMTQRQFTPGFRIDLHHKDMGIVIDTARAVGLPLPIGGIIAQLFVAARAQGLGSLDHSGLLAVLENLAGIDDSSLSAG